MAKKKKCFWFIFGLVLLVTVTLFSAMLNKEMRINNEIDDIFGSNLDVIFGCFYILPCFISEILLFRGCYLLLDGKYKRNIAKIANLVSIVTSVLIIVCYIASFIVYIFDNTILLIASEKLLAFCAVDVAVSFISACIPVICKNDAI